MMKTLLMVVALLSAPSTSAFAQAHAHGAHDGHGGAKPSTPATETASTKALRAANDRMHQDMDITYTGDADVDFLRGMIAHHQGAVEMAQVALDHGDNPQVRRLAREIIRAQNLEIKWMQEWLKQLDPHGTPVAAPKASATPRWHDAAWDGSTWMGER